MHIIKASDFRSRFKEMASAASDGEVVFITRPHDENVVLLSVAQYQALSALRKTHDITPPTAAHKSKLEDIRFHLTNEKLGVRATGCYEDGKFVILKGSQGRHEDGTTSSAIRSILNHRRNLRENGIVDDAFMFLKDKAFSSPSLAANILLSRTANGRTCWITKDGESINAVFESMGIHTR
ncbi:DUF4357 domain-containing protein [Eubacteriales bacterium OttesenSCG-928-A19]|nr:DUF4357 domain-containing protein [Eubacteriales bacterium OttesenSCG-928-A19]